MYGIFGRPKSKKISVCGSCGYEGAIRKDGGCCHNGFSDSPIVCSQCRSADRFVMKRKKFNNLNGQREVLAYVNKKRNKK